MIISIAQLNYRVGNFDYNKSLICAAIGEAKKQGADLVVFTELCVSGYPPLSLLSDNGFIEKCSRIISDIAAECSGIAAIVGAPEADEKKLFNSAFVLSEGKIIFSARKALLPTYDSFDERRYFTSGEKFSIFHFKGKKIAITICEDLWDERPSDSRFEKPIQCAVSPMEKLTKLKPDMVINIAALPFSSTAIDARENIMKDKAVRYNLPVISTNQVGANAEFIFEGNSVAITAGGAVGKRLPLFEESRQTFDADELVNPKETVNAQTVDRIEAIHDALIMGIKDYFAKTGFSKAILGLSGGIDSAIALYLAAKALGGDNVRSLIMPSRYSSAHSVDDAIDLSKRLNARFDIINIEKSFNTFEEDLAPLFIGKERDITEENIQARVRAVFLMAVANKFGSILINTSNKSEAAVGYGTLYGDISGGLSVIGDVYKTDVYRLAAYINREEEIIPYNIIMKPPSAELSPNQLDSDSLPEYDTLDNILYQYIELRKPVDEIIDSVNNRETVCRVIKLINSSEYKRYQSPPALRVSSKALIGRQTPLATR